MAFVSDFAFIAQNIYSHAIVQLLSWRQASCPACLESLIALLYLFRHGPVLQKSVVTDGTFRQCTNWHCNVVFDCCSDGD